MCPDNTIYDFFVKEDNLETALDLADNVKEFKKDMHKAFWIEFNSQMRFLLHSQSLTEKWELDPYPTKRIFKDWQKSFILPVQSLRTRPHFLMFGFGQGGPEGGYPLFWGVRWNTQPQEYESREKDELIAKLTSMNMSITEVHWIRWGWCKRILYSADTLKRIYLDPYGLLEEITKDIWSLFSEIYLLMEQINSEITK